MDIKKGIENLRIKVSEKVKKAKETRISEKTWAKEFTETNKGKCCRLISKALDGKIFKIVWIFNMNRVERNPILPCFVVYGERLVELYPKTSEIFFNHPNTLFDSGDDMFFFDSYEDATNDMSVEVTRRLKGEND